jgi:hypothetical protein
MYGFNKFCSLLAVLLLNAFIASPQNVSISLIPINPPIVIPDSGGTFIYLIHVQNLGTTPLNANVWVKLRKLPDGDWIGPLLVLNRILPGGANITRYYNQIISDTLTGGSYLFEGAVGVYPNTIWSRSSFPFEISSPGGTELWINRFGSTCGQTHIKLKIDNNDNIYVAGGFSSYVVKYNSLGELLWSASIPGRSIYDLTIDNQGNVYITGRIVADLFAAKYNTDGILQWQTIEFMNIDRHNVGMCITTDMEGNAYVAGVCDLDMPSQEDYITLKYDSSGHRLWSQRYNGGINSYSEWPTSIAIDNSQNVIVTGCSMGPSGSYYDCATVKYDDNGNQLWVTRFDGEGHGDFANALTLDNNDNIYITGSTGTSLYGSDYLTIKYDINGNLVWWTSYDGPVQGNDEASAICISNDGFVYVTGYSNGSGTSEDYATIKYTASGGGQMWVRRYNYPSYPYPYWEEAKSIAVDDGNNILVAGLSGNSVQISTATIKYDSNGDQKWVTRSQEIVANSIDHDSFNGVYVAGYSGVEPCNRYTTIKYSGGNLIDWEPSKVTEFKTTLPLTSRLNPAYPNPFNATTTLTYIIPTAARISLSIYDVTGRCVTTLVDGNRDAGSHQLTFDGSKLPSGEYFASLKAGRFSNVQKLILLK